MSRFLPHSRRDYAIPPEGDESSFSVGGPEVLRSIGQRMSVSASSSEGRVPTPFSRAFRFWLDLFGQELDQDASGDGQEEDADPRESQRRTARRTFRGLCAAFALRKVFSADIELQHYSLEGDGWLEEALLQAAQSAPYDARWWTPLRFYAFRDRLSSRSQVFAGISPLSGIYPSAVQPALGQGLFWYDDRDGTWYDPTSDDIGSDLPNEYSYAGSRTRERVVTLLRAWVKRVSSELGDGDYKGRLVRDFGFEERSINLLRNEFADWLAELDPHTEGISVVEETLGSGSLPTGVRSLPFLDFVCDEDHLQALVSDLPVSHDRRLLVTREQLRRRSVRLYGREFGRPEYEVRVDGMAATGENLGVALGLDEDRIPRPYVLIDQLFTERLSLISRTGVSRSQWHGLTIDDGDDALYPFRPEILEFFSPDELTEACAARLSTDQKHYVVSLSFEGVEVTHLYSTGDDGARVVDDLVRSDELDLRIFPDFEYPDDAGGKYYARLRLAPSWRFGVSAIRWDGVDLRVGDEGLVFGNEDEIAERGLYRVGQYRIFESDQRPAGFWFDGRGLCFVRLREQADKRSEWDVGVDFGTSNTCLSYRVRGGDRSDPRLLEFPVSTTSLLPEFAPRSFEHPRGGAAVNEGAAPLLDFFFRYNQDDQVLNPRAYFPTQFVTRFESLPAVSSWDFEAGLVFFRHITFGGKLISIWDLLEGYPNTTSGEHAWAKTFRIRQNIKWEQRTWLRAFMKHLKLQIQAAALRSGATVQSVRFSYPKAFTAAERQTFLNTIGEVWPEAGDTPAFSESEAITAEVVRDSESASQHIVLDIGGGTTDVMLYAGKEPAAQCSFRLAAGDINRYVTESAPFRRLIHQRAESGRVRVQLLQLGDLFRESLSPASVDRIDPKRQVIESIWLGLLDLVDPEESEDRLIALLDEIRIVAPETDGNDTYDAVRGFFLSVTLLLGGIAFYSGKMLRAALAGKFGATDATDDDTSVHLHFLGNGSKLLSMMDDRTRKFDGVLGALAGAGLGDGGIVTSRGIYRYEDRISPKVPVAMGLLRLDEARAERARQTPVANLLGDRLSVGENVLDEHSNLLDFYRNDWQAVRLPEEPPPILDEFLLALEEALPRDPSRVSVLPWPDTDWVAYVRSLYPDARAAMRVRMRDNATRAEAAEDGDSSAHEPFFITELAALIREVRHRLADTGR